MNKTPREILEWLSALIIVAIVAFGTYVMAYQHHVRTMPKPLTPEQILELIRKEAEKNEPKRARTIRLNFGKIPDPPTGPKPENYYYYPIGSVVLAMPFVLTDA